MIYRHIAVRSLELSFQPQTQSVRDAVKQRNVALTFARFDFDHRREAVNACLWQGRIQPEVQRHVPPARGIIDRNTPFPMLKPQVETQICIPDRTRKAVADRQSHGVILGKNVVRNSLFKPDPEPEPVSVSKPGCSLSVQKRNRTGRTGRVRELPFPPQRDGATGGLADRNFLIKRKPSKVRVGIAPIPCLAEAGIECRWAGKGGTLSPVTGKCLK